MIRSMTGFGRSEQELAPFGKVSVELRSTNHKFVETVLHVPEGFLSLEDRIKKEIEARVKRGRVVCVVNIVGGAHSEVFINTPLLAKYVATLKQIREKLYIKDELSINTLVHLPGVVSLAENVIPTQAIWPKLRPLLSRAVEGLQAMRVREGKALEGFVRRSVRSLGADIQQIEKRFARVIQGKASRLATDEERSSFLKNADITEELDRIKYHVKNMANKLGRSVPVGKELDFIAQEMQREANTMGAKSCDALISARVVEIKSSIEKIREQVQNIE